MNQQFVFPYLGRVLDRGPEYSAVKERWVHTCVLPKGKNYACHLAKNHAKSCKNHA